MPRRIRLRDYLACVTATPPLGTEPEHLIRRITDDDALDPEEVARLCRRGQLRTLERVDEILREEKRRDR